MESHRTKKKIVKTSDDSAGRRKFAQLPVCKREGCQGGVVGQEGGQGVGSAHVGAEEHVVVGLGRVQRQTSNKAKKKKTPHGLATGP